MGSQVAHLRLPKVRPHNLGEESQLMQLNKMENTPVRMLLSGFPGSGKTGALASLANAGWKLRILDFDGNYEVLKHYVKPNADVDIVSFEDPVRMGSRTMGVDGVPTAFVDADRLLDRWRYKDGDNWTDLGASKQWGKDTIVCLDGATGLARACWYKALVLTNSRADGDMRRVYDLAGGEFTAFIQRCTSSSNGYHFLCISHLRIIGPPEVGRTDDETVKEAKRFQGNAIPLRLYPDAVGTKVSFKIAGDFPAHIRARVDDTTGKPKRVLDYMPTTEVDLKLPASEEALKALGKLDAADGLVKIFAALGHTAPTQGETV